MAARRRPGLATALAAAIAAALASGGCYEYVPVPMTSVPPQTNVRLRVSEAGAARLAKDLGAFTTELDGRLAPNGADSVSMSVLVERQYRGMALESTPQTFMLGRSEIVDVRRRVLSRKRTVLATIGTVAAFGLLAGTVAQLVDPNPPSDGNPPPPPPSPVRWQIRIPIR